MADIKGLLINYCNDVSSHQVIKCSLGHNSGKLFMWVFLCFCFDDQGGFLSFFYVLPFQYEKYRIVQAREATMEFFFLNQFYLFYLKCDLFIYTFFLILSHIHIFLGLCDIK